MVPLIDVIVHAHAVTLAGPAHKLPHAARAGLRNAFVRVFALDHGQPRQVRWHSGLGKLAPEIGHVLVAAVQPGLERLRILRLDFLDLGQNPVRQREINLEGLPPPADSDS